MVKWAEPENVTSLVGLLQHTYNIFPYFPGLILIGIFFTSVMIFKPRGPLPHAIVAAGWITFICATFFSLMGVISGYIVVGIAVGLAFCLLWLWMSN